MHLTKTATALLATGLLGVLTVFTAASEDTPKADPPSAEPAPLIVLDSTGKELKLKSWKFVQGTRRLAWLAAPAEATEPKPKEPVPPKGPRPKAPPVRQPVGPEAVAFREENSTGFKNGILTLIPLDQLKSMDFDTEKRLATVKVAISDKADEDVAVTGTTKYESINKIAIEAEVDKGDLGVAEVRYLGGVLKGGIRGLRFPKAKKAAAPKGRPATITVEDKGTKTEMPVTDLQALYGVANGGEKLSPLLFFKKTLKIDMAKLKKIAKAEGDGQETVWQLTLKDGNEETLTLLQSVMLDGEPAELKGLLGRVPVGYKLFPTHLIEGVEFEPTKEKDKDPDKEKDKDK